MTDDSAAESHGIFQFAADVFDQEPKKIRHHIDWTYKPKETGDGWMLKVLENIDDVFARKTGPSELLNAIEWLYVRRRYTDCLDGCKEWIRVNSTLKKPYKVSEIGIIAVRSCWKLDRNQDALDFMSLVEDLRDPGIQFVRAEVFIKVGQYEDALRTLLKYVQMRRNDYLAWKMMAIVFELLESSASDQLSSSFVKIYQHKCLSKCIALLDRMERPETDFSKIHQDTEIAPLKEKLSRLSTQLPDSSMQYKATIDSHFNISPSMLEDIDALLASGQNHIHEEDDERRVTDL